MEDLSVEELLLNISEVENDEKSAHQAFAVLYQRFSEFLQGAVMSMLRNKGIYSEEIVDTVVSNTFIEVYNKPLGFTYNSDNHKSEKLAFKAWICRIARNEFIDILKENLQKRSLISTVDDEQVILEFEELEIEEGKLSENMKALQLALGTLTERERHILLSCYDHYEDGKNTPSNIINMLCEYWGTTKDNVRQIKKRALDKVKKYLLDKLKLKPQTK